MHSFRLTVAFVLLALPAPANATTSDWVSAVRSCVERKNFDCATSIVDNQLKINPSDLEAQTWRARLYAWTGAWDHAERQYQAVLAARADDAEALLGLADVQIWSGELSAALGTLDRAERARAPAIKVSIRRARIYSRMHRNDDARRAYKRVLELTPSNQEARSAIDNLAERRHQLRIGSDADTFNYTDAANAESLSLESRWNDRWSTQFVTTFFHLGENAQTANAGATYRFTQNNWVTAIGGIGTPQNIAPEEEVSAEYGHGFRMSAGAVRGIESYALFRNFWYSASHVITVGTTQVVYLPHDWMWAVQVTGVRTAFNAAAPEWVPAGFTRLTWPLSSRLTANALFAVGAENFSTVDQIGQFSAHTFGGGAKLKLNSRQDISGYVTYQRRTQRRTETSLGLSYGIRF